MSTFFISPQQNDLSKVEEDITKGFDKHDGPFVQALHEALSSFNVQRQAYYPGTFVGNHIHTTLKVKFNLCQCFICNKRILGSFILS